MPVTSPDNIYYQDTSTTWSAATESATQATSIQNALGTRAQRTYKWANAAARAEQTGMTSGDLGIQLDTQALYRYNGTAWRNASNGLIPIVPSTVSGTGVSVDAHGRINISSGTTISATCFSSEFTNYKVIVRATVSASTGDPLLKLRLGSTDTSVNYVYSKTQTQISTGSIIGNNTPTTSFDIGRVTTTAAGWSIFELTGPNQPFKTGLTGNAADDAFVSYVIGTQTDSTQFDGFSFIWPGNVTANIWVYGYNDGTA